MGRANCRSEDVLRFVGPVELLDVVEAGLGGDAAGEEDFLFGPERDGGGVAGFEGFAEDGGEDGEGPGGEGYRGGAVSRGAADQRELQEVRV